MLERTVFAVLAVVLLTAPLKAQDCPTEGSGWEGREDAVRKAPTCNEALKVAEACAYTATGDTGLTNIVIEKCQARFLIQLSKAQRRTYDRAMQHCDNKYKNQSGTMYRSFSAFCRAILARDTAAKFARVPPRK
jgi:hypothetical protein